MVRRLPVVVLAVAIAVGAACSTFSSGESPADTADSGSDAMGVGALDDAGGPPRPQDDTGVSPQEDASSDAKCVTTACDVSDLACDRFERSTAYVGWTVYGDEKVEITDGGCSGGVMHVNMPALKAEAGVQTRMLSRSDQNKILTNMIAELDVFVDVNITLYSGSGLTTIFAVANNGSVTQGGRYTAINIDKGTGAAAVVRQGSGSATTTANITQSFTLPLNEWVHVRYVVTFDKIKGRVALFLNGSMVFDIDDKPTLPPEAVDAPGFSTSLGVQCKPTSPEVNTYFDNFKLVVN